MEKNDIIELCVTGYGSGGEGVARHEGRAVFVRGALVGERVDARILKVTPKAAFAKTERIIEASGERAEPECECYPRCGGCDTMHMSYSEELRFKEQRVADAFAHIAGIDIKPEPIVPSDRISAYRNKAIFEVAAGANGKTAAGFFRERSHDVVPAPNCRVQSELSLRAADALCEYCDMNGIKCRNLFVRSGEKSNQAIVVVTKPVKQERELVIALTRAVPELTSIGICVNPADTNVPLTDKIKIIYGAGYYEGKIGGNTFSIAPQAFFQVNTYTAQLCYEKAAQYANLIKDETALDLFCGAGTITLYLAKYAKKVVGVDTVKEAIENASENAARNNIENVSFTAGDAGEALESLNKKGERFDVIVVDPPRKGLDPGTIEAIVKAAPRAVVYMSCDPATLARDVKLFSGKNYQLKRNQPFDMFPRTSHVETVALLQRSNA